MSVTHPSGLSCGVNRGLVLATFLLSACGLAALGWTCLFRFHSQANWSSIVYGVCLFVCSLFSYLYNSRLLPIALNVLRKMDHAAIFLLIAGTYTPFLTISVLGPFGIPLLYSVWVLAAAGIILRLSFSRKYDRFFVGLYLVLGWLFVTALPQIIHQTDQFPLIFLGLGAIFYSVGAIIFARDIGRWTDPVWHGFVLTAAGLHFVAVYDLVA